MGQRNDDIGVESSRTQNSDERIELPCHRRAFLFQPQRLLGLRTGVQGDLALDLGLDVRASNTASSASSILTRATEEFGDQEGRLRARGHGIDIESSNSMAGEGAAFQKAV